MYASRIVIVLSDLIELYPNFYILIDGSVTCWKGGRYFLWIIL